MKESDFGNVKFVGKSITLGKGIFIDDNTVIHDNVEIDDEVEIGRNVTIYNNVRLGKGTIIDNNVILGYQSSSALSREEELSSTEVGEEVIIRSNSMIYAGCKIGDYSKINHNVVLRELTLVGAHTSIGSLTECEGYTRIGDFCAIHALNIIAQSMIIEDYMFIGTGTVMMSDRHMYYRRDPVKKMEPKGPTIKFGARIASNVTIIPELIVGRESVVEAGSLVNENVPDFKIVSGFPARIIGEVPEAERLKTRIA